MTAVGAVLLTLIAVELTLRVVGFDPLGEAQASKRPSQKHMFLQQSALPELDYELVPGYEGKVWGSQVQINSHGFRGREVTIVKPPGVQRIVFIGDSITFGNRIAIEDTFPVRLEESIGDPSVQVLNLGVGGYDTLQAVLRLEQLGLKFRPDRVVLVYCINDAGVASVNRRYVERLAGYDAPIYQLRVVQLLAVNRDRLALAKHAKGALDDLQFAKQNRPWIVDVTSDAGVNDRIEQLRSEIDGLELPRDHRFLPWYGSSARIGKLRFSFARLAALADTEGFEVAAVIVPHLDEGEYADSYAIVYEAVRHEAERVGFEIIDVIGSFQAEGLAAVRENAIHPNERGQEIIAERVQEQLFELAPSAPGL